MSRTQRLVLTIAVLAAFVSFLDGSVINVALPAILADLGGELVLQQWIVDAYLITLGSLILVAGSLSDVYGRVVVLRAGLIGFGVTSLMCALAPSGEFLVISRGLQGIAGALLVPSSLAIILSNFRDAAQARAIGLWTAWTSAAFIAGPLLGGLFVDLLSWRWIFAINVPPIAVTLGLLMVLGQKDTREDGVTIDWLGAILSLFGLGLPVFALIEQARLGWSNPAIWVSFVLGVVVFAAFLWRQRVAPNPLMPLGVFRVRNFAVGNIATVAIYGALALGGFIITVYLQGPGGFTATAAGASLLPVTVLNVALSSFFGSLAGKHGPRLFMAVGPIVAGLGFLLLLRINPDANYLIEVLPGVLVFGLGMTITVAPLTAAILGSISARQAGIGSAINNAVSRIAGLIAIAMLGVIVGAGLDEGGFQRGLVVIAGLLMLGGVVSAVGISDAGVQRHDADAAAVSSPTAPVPPRSPEESR